MMPNVLAIDLETKNMSHEIGGWENTHMFQVSTVCTWDGDVGTIYIDKSVDDLKKSNVIIKPLSELKRIRKSLLIGLIFTMEE